MAVDGDGYTVATDRGTWRCASVVLASGMANVASVPSFAAGLPASIDQVTPLTYRSPAQLADGGVLVVGGSATGVQLADEIHRSGRPVTLAVGEHVRMPRTYAGRDIFWWLDAAGVLDERHDEVDDLVRARHVPSPQLIGTPERRTLDVNTLGRNSASRSSDGLGAVRDGVVLCSGALANTCRLADLKLGRLLDRFDRWAGLSRRRASVTDPRCPPRPSSSTCAGGASAPSCGPPASPPTCRGWTSRCSITAAGCATPAASSAAPPACTSSAAACCAPGGRATSPAPADDTAALAAHLHGHLDATRRLLSA